MSRESGVEIVNPVPADEAAAWTRAEVTTFLSDPDSAEGRHWIDLNARAWDPSRNWGARAGGRWVGTVATEPRSLTVPGADLGTRDVAVDAVTAVTVAASHRRRGVMTRMVEDAMRAARERGEAISVLIAAEWQIYGRFGFAPATVMASYTLRRTQPGSSVEGDPTRVYQVDREEFGDHAHSVFAAARALHPGQIDRSVEWWNSTLGRDGFEPALDRLPAIWMLHAGPDGPDGLLGWRADRPGPPGSHPIAVITRMLAAASDDAYRDIWAYLSGIDGADEVVVSARSVDEPVRWLLGDARALVMTRQQDMLWLRILDVPAALAARRYLVPGDVVLEVLDASSGSGYAAGRYRLVADGDEVTCEPTNAAPDLEITERALASIYLGGYRLLPQLLARTAVEHTPGAAALVDRMFSSAVTPWNATWF